jgi:PAS domain S-box-containing protein
MMKIPGFLLFLLLFHSFAFSEELSDGDKKGDRILTAGHLIKLAGDSLEKNTDIAITYASSALLLSTQLNYEKGQLDALNLLANCYLKNEEYVKTLDCYFKITDLYDQRQDIPNLVVGYTRICNFFFEIIKDYDLANKYLLLMAREARKSNDPDIQGQVFLLQGQYYLSKGEYPAANSNFFLSLPYFQKSHDSLMEAAVYKYLGDAFKAQKMYRIAEYNYQLAIGFYTQLNCPAEIAVIYTRIAHIYQVLGIDSLNLEYNLSALLIREKVGHSYLIASSYLNVGEAYWLLGNKAAANYYLMKSLKLAKRINSTKLLEALYSQLADFAKAEKRFLDAMEYYTAHMEYRNKKNLDRNQTNYRIYEANRTISASEAKNDRLKKDTQIQKLQIRNNRIQIYLYEAAFIIMLLLIFFIDKIARKNRKRKNELKELNNKLAQEINVRIEAEASLKRSEELHRFLAENTVDVISLLDSGLRRIYVSPSCKKLYGYTAEEILGMNSPLDLVEPSFHVYVNQRLIEMFRSKNTTRYIYKILRKDLTTVWAEANINPILDPESNEVKNMITVVRDISERMKNEEKLFENSRQKEFLLREIHNRVKNNFAILISLMNMQRDQSTNPELSISLTDLQLRVKTMSLVHEQLYQTQEISAIPFDNYLHHLALIIASSFDNSRISMQTEIHPCNVSIEMALPLGLIINELITNVYKYAFPEDHTGEIWVRLLPEKEDKYCIMISDNGIGLPAGFSMKSTQTMGSQIIGILVEQIEATIEFSSNGGACFKILFSTAQEM